MSSVASIDVLAQTPGNRDPTRTQTLRRNYASRLRGQLARLNSTIREAVQSQDIFRLQQDVLQPVPPQPPDGSVYRFATDDEKITAFIEWLSRQEARGVLEVISDGENQFIRSAYSKGVTHADAALRDEGITVPDTDLQNVFNAPMHRDTLQRLYTRNFSELEGITNTMNQQISRELADGFSRGVSPTEMARNITDRVDAVGKHRATVLARTETIRAHSEATLNRYEEFGTETVTVSAEWLTAGDRRVCPICETLEGNTYTIQEARSETFSYSASESEPPSLSGSYPVQPPAHPGCRCSFTPRVS